MSTHKPMFSYPKIGEWAKVYNTGQRGCVHKILSDGRYVLLVPAEDWPFPTWVYTSPDNLVRIRRPKQVDDLELTYDLEPALM